MVNSTATAIDRVAGSGPTGRPGERCRASFIAGWTWLLKAEEFFLPRDSRPFLLPSGRALLSVMTRWPANRNVSSPVCVRLAPSRVGLAPGFPARGRGGWGRSVAKPPAKCCRAIGGDTALTGHESACECRAAVPCRVTLVRAPSTRLWGGWHALSPRRAWPSPRRAGHGIGALGSTPPRPSAEPSGRAIRPR